MPSLDKPPVATTTVKWRFPAVHPEGWKFVAISVGLTLLATLVWNVLFWPFVGLTIWVAAFFRDPVPRELDGPNGLPPGPRVRVSIFMSVFDVHINRTPIAGIVRQVVYVSGKFLNADLDKASEENERQYFVVEDHHGRRVGFTQIAGLVARRIMGFVKPGDTVAAGQRIGLIRFGSRVDVFLPDDCVCQVALGQRSIAGETVLGRVGAAPVTGVAQ